MASIQPTRTRLSLYLALACVAGIAVSCAQSRPEIRSNVVQLLRIQGPAGSFSERLSVFTYFADSDGTADFGSIVVTHAETGLTWTITPEEATVRLRGNDRWTGSNNLAGPGDEALPSGTYVITVNDLAGNEATRSFTLVRPEFPEYAPVKFTSTGDSWILDRSPQGSSFTRTYFFLYDEGMTLVQSWLVPETSESRVVGTVESLRALAPDVYSVQCYTENADGSAGVLLTPVNIE